MKRLWRRLINKKPPTLVVPVPVIGPSAEHIAQAEASDPERFFLWGCERIEAIRFGENLLIPVE